MFRQKILEDNASELETDGTVTLKAQPITACCTIKHTDNFHELMSITATVVPTLSPRLNETF